MTDLMQITQARTIKQLLVLTFVANFFIFAAYLSLEPSAVSAQVEDQIVITLGVTGEVSITSPSDVSMSPSLASISGGTSNGYASWTIVCTDNAGFTATLTASGTPANDYVLLGDTQGDYFDNYTEGTYGVPDYTWSVTNGAEFGYTATTTTSSDLSSSFLSNGVDTCNTGATMTEAQCWIDASTTARTLMNRPGEASSGTVLGLQFRAEIDNHAVTEDTYTATTTVTVTVN